VGLGIPAVNEIDRTTFLGGSDAAGVVGLSRWSSPVTVWAEKTGLTPQRDTVPLRMWIGQYMEPMLAEMAEARTGLRFVRDRRLHRVRGVPYLAGHVDFRARRRRVGLEVKTARSDRYWGEDGLEVTPDDFTAVPIDYYVQVQHYLMVTGWDEFVLAVLIGHDDFRTYRVIRNPDLIGNLRAAEIEFWEHYVLTETPPAVDGSEAASEYLRRRYPRNDELLPAATPEQEELIAEVVKQKDHVRHVKALADGLENRLRAEIGDHGGLLSTQATVTWRRSKDTEDIDWATVALAYRNMLEAAIPPGGALSWTDATGEVHTVPRDALDTIVGLYTFTKPGSRRLLVKPFSEEDSRA